MTNEGYEEKRLELIKRAVPGVTRVAVLVDPAPGLSLEDSTTVKGLRAVAQALGVQLQFLEAKRPDDFDGAFAAMTRERAEALYVSPSVTFFQHHQRLMALALERRLPTMHWRAELAFSPVGRSSAGAFGRGLSAHGRLSAVVWSRSRHWSTHAPLLWHHGGAAVVPFRLLGP